MSPNRPNAAAHRWPRRVAFLALVLIVGAAPAAETSAQPENSFSGSRPTAAPRDSLLARLLTWPDKDQKDEGAGDEEDKEEPLESDRPDFTESSTTVGAKVFQIESGYTYTHGAGGDPTNNKHDLPEMLLRYGLAERLELRVAWDEGLVFDRYLDRHTGRYVTDNGLTDTEFGVKYALTKQDHWLPQTAIIAAATAPVGTFDQSSRQVDARVDYCYSWELTKKLNLACSTENVWTAESGDHFSYFAQSASLEYELTKRFHVYNEWYVLVPHAAEDNRAQNYYDGGCTYLVTPNFQLDWRAGFGLTGAADRFFTGCGLTIRR
jgi:hypothetical protein